MEHKYIYVFEEEEKEKLEKQGLRLIKKDKPYIFANDKTKMAHFNQNKVIFSDVMQF